MKNITVVSITVLALSFILIAQSNPVYELDLPVIYLFDLFNFFFKAFTTFCFLRTISMNLYLDLTKQETT